MASVEIKENSKTPNINFFGFQKQIIKIAKDIQNHQKKHIFASNKSSNAHVDGRILKSISPENKEVVKLKSLKKLKTSQLRKMKVRSSLKNLKTRDRNNKLIKRKGRLYVINKRNPRMKARQG